MFSRVGDVARLLDVPENTVRYWADEFEVRPLRSSGAQRHFEPAQVETMKEIHRLLRTELYTIEGAKRQLRKAKDDQ